MALVNKYPEDIIDVLRKIVQDMTFPVVINIAVDNGDGTHTIKVDDYYHAQPGFEITIGGNKYTIVELISGCTLKVKGSPAITATSFNIYSPFFFHGTPMETNRELIEIPNTLNKSPMVWVLENFSEEFTEDPDSMVERESEVRIFFLAEANFEKWGTKDFYSNAIKPMRRLFESFKAALNSSGKFDMEDYEYKLINYTRFGVYINNKGFDKSLMADNLSGCECASILKKLREDINDCVECGADCSVIFTSLSAPSGGGAVSVNWSVVSPVGLSTFDVRRSSTQNGSFTKINTNPISYTGDSNYQFSDANPLQGANWYKIVGYCADGSIAGVSNAFQST